MLSPGSFPYILLLLGKKSVVCYAKDVLCYIEIGNIEVTLYWLNPRMDFSHVDRQLNKDVFPVDEDDEDDFYFFCENLH